MFVRRVNHPRYLLRLLVVGAVLSANAANAQVKTPTAPKTAAKPKATATPKTQPKLPPTNLSAATKATTPSTGPSFHGFSPAKVNLTRPFDIKLEVRAPYPLDTLYTKFGDKESAHSLQRTMSGVYVVMRSPGALPIAAASNPGNHWLYIVGVRRSDTKKRVAVSNVKFRVLVTAPAQLTCNKGEPAPCTCAASKDGTSMQLPYKAIADAVSSNLKALYVVSGVAGKEHWIARWDWGTRCETARLPLKKLMETRAWTTAALGVHPTTGRLYLALARKADYAQMPFAGAYPAQDGVFLELDPVTLAIRRAGTYVPLGSGGNATLEPQHMLFSADGKRAYILGSGQHSTFRGVLAQVQLDKLGKPGSTFAGVIAKWAKDAGKTPASTWRFGITRPSLVPKTDWLLVPADLGTGDMVTVDAKRQAFVGVDSISQPKLIGFIGDTLYLHQGSQLKSSPKSNVAHPSTVYGLPWGAHEHTSSIADAAANKLLIAGRSEVLVFDVLKKTSTKRTLPERVYNILAGRLSRRVLARSSTNSFSRYSMITY